MRGEAETGPLDADGAKALAAPGRAWEGRRRAEVEGSIPAPCGAPPPWIGSRAGGSSCSATASSPPALTGLERLVETAFTRSRSRLPDRANVDLDRLRLLLRLAKESGYLDPRRDRGDAGEIDKRRSGG